MNEQRVTYAEVKLAKDSKRSQVKPKGSKSSTTGTEQGVTYAELSLHNAARDPQENGKSCHLKGLAAPPEKHIARILGLTCLVLICMIVTVWVISHSSYKEPEKNDSSSELNACPNGTTSKKAYLCGPCPNGWFSYSNNCYYYSAEKSTWNESMTACECMDSQLLYIESEEEMRFMKSLRVFSWTGIYRNGSGQPWTLVNGSTVHLEIRQPVPDDNHCLMLVPKYYAEKCEDKHTYYCKHKI